jgi:OFA family oxalate/formate antiporter-like MFS transporter
VLLVMLVLAVVALLLLWQAGSYLPVVAGVFVVGLCYGGFLALIGPVTLDAFGARHFPVNFGIMFLSVAVASFAGPRLAAAVAQTNEGAYNQAFLVAAIMTLVALALAAVYAGITRRKSASEPCPGWTNDPS